MTPKEILDWLDSDAKFYDQQGYPKVANAFRETAKDIRHELALRAANLIKQIEKPPYNPEGQTK